MCKNGHLNERLNQDTQILISKMRTFMVLYSELF